MSIARWTLCAALLFPLQAVQDRRELPARLANIAGRAFEKGDAERLEVRILLGTDTLASLSHGSRPGERVVFPLDACAHLLFAGVAMQLSDGGQPGSPERLDLELPIGPVVPELGDVGARITAHQLLTHTAGFGEWREFKGATPAERLAKLGQAGLIADPGTCFCESSGDTFVLGVLLARLGKAPVVERVESGLFDPAGATEVRGCKERTFEPGIATALGERELCGSADDLAALMRTLAARRLTSEEVWLAMTTGDVLPDGTRTRFGHGFDLSRLGEHERIAFGGEGVHPSGARISVAYHPSFDMTIVAAASGMREGRKLDVDALSRSLARAVFAIDDPNVRDLPLDPEDAARFTGDFLIGCDLTRVEFAERRLVLKLLRRPELVLLAQGGDEFVARDDHDLRVRFHPGEDRSPGFQIFERGFESTAKRID